MKNISEKAFKKLTEFLHWREFDIAELIEDLGGLQEVFKEVLGREPEGLPLK